MNKEKLFSDVLYVLNISYSFPTRFENAAYVYFGGLRRFYINKLVNVCDIAYPGNIHGAIKFYQVRVRAHVH